MHTSKVLQILLWVILSLIELPLVKAEINVYSFPYGTPLELVGSEQWIDVNRIRFMSAHATDEIELSTLKSPLHVWQDTSGRIFTLDQSYLAHVIETKLEHIKVKWASAEEVRRHYTQFNTANLGLGIELTHLGDGSHSLIQSGYGNSDQQLMDRALAFAVRAHGDQKYGSFPYVYHLGAVVSVLHRFGLASPKRIVAAYLHDTLEDTSTQILDISNAFGADIAAIVWAVTNEASSQSNDNNEKVKALIATYNKIISNRDALIIKLADRIANTEESIYAPQKNRLGKLDRYQKQWSIFEKSLRRSKAPLTSDLFASLGAENPSSTSLVAIADPIDQQIEELWRYLFLITWHPIVARGILPSPHQRACEVALISASPAVIQSSSSP